MIKRHLSLTIFGIGGGQAIMLLATPLLARRYDPGAFGDFAVVVAVSGVVAAIAALRLDLAISTADDAELASVTRGALVLPFLVVPIASAILAACLRSPLAVHMPFGEADLPVIAALALFQGLVLVGSGASTRKGAFRTLAAAKIVQPLVFVSTALMFLPSLALAATAGWVAALAAASPVLRPALRQQGWGRTRSALKRLWRFPLISTPMALLDVLALALPLLIIAAAFGEDDAGNYSQVQRLIGAPLVLVATAGAQTFLKHAGDKVRGREPVTPLLSRFVVIMAGLAGFVTIAVAGIGSQVLSLLLGPGWRTDSGFLLLTLAPVLWRVVASPVSSILIVTDRITALAAWQISYFLVTAATLAVAGFTLTLDQTLAALALSELLMYAAYLILSVQAARQADARAGVARASAAFLSGS